MNKKEEFTTLRNRIKNCSACVNSDKKRLVNVIKKNHEHAPETIGYWSDAFRNYNAKLMIVGQDWGSMDYLHEFANKYGGKLPKPYHEDGNDTWENLMHCLKEAGFETKVSTYGFTDIYLTNAVACLREGKMSGNNDFSNKWLTNCFPILKKQIEIIRPDVIATLGQKVFDVFVKEYNLPKYTKFKDVFAKKHSKNSITIFPLYHTGYYGVFNRGGKNKEKGLLNMIEDFRKLRKVLYN